MDGGAGETRGSVVARLFAGLEAKTREGRAQLSLPAEAAPTVAALLEAVGLDRRAAGIILVNGLHADEAAALHAGDEVAIFPPLGGG